MSGVTDFPDEESRSAESKGISVRFSKLPNGQRIAKFYRDVILEMKKVAWPARTQVWSTTVVVVIAVIFFGFYLFGCDTLFNQFFKLLEKTINKR